MPFCTQSYRGPRNNANARSIQFSTAYNFLPKDVYDAIIWILLSLAFPPFLKFSSVLKYCIILLALFFLVFLAFDNVDVVL